MRMRTFLKLRKNHDKTENWLITRIKFFTLKVDSFGSMNHVTVLYEYVKNTNKNFLKFHNKTRQEIGLQRMQLNKAINRLVEYGTLEVYREKSAKIYRVVREKL